MSDPDDRQAERRDAIQAEAWKLMAERGYEGVTMRELSRRTGVSTRTLYEMYGNKDALLGEAFRNRLVIVFDRFEAAISAKGVDHLMQLNAAIVRSILGSENFSRAYASVLASNRISIYTIETPVTHFRRCLEEIRRDGSLKDWVDLDLTARRILLAQNAIMIQWGNGTISGANLDAFYGMSLCEILIPLTEGSVVDRLQAHLEAIHNAFRGITVF